jgi:hypothetical protein
MKKYLFSALFLFNLSLFAQVPFEHISTSNVSAERVAKFGIVDTSTDFLEITNSTQFANSFIPSIWAHQQSDNRFVLRLFATTTQSFDNGDVPVMMFRTEIRSQLNNNAPNNYAFPWGSASADIANRPSFAWENGNNQLMTLRANGYLGLGTITPSALFHTVGTIRHQDLPNKVTPVFMLGTDADGNVAEYPVPVGGGTGGVADVDWLKPDNTIATNINDPIYTNGNVGINVQNPSAALDVSGTVRLQNLSVGTNAQFMLGTDSNGNVSTYPLPTAGITDADWLKLDGSLPLSINDNIYTNGKVGINVNDLPESVGSEDISFYSLFVKGGILTEEVRVALEDEWADYVFKENYMLAPLAEVEDYIKANGHLKNIPSAEEVKNNGIELAQMNKNLLEKVEELTLYIIELNKRLDDQQNKLIS